MKNKSLVRIFTACAIGSALAASVARADEHYNQQPVDTVGSIGSSYTAALPEIDTDKPVATAIYEHFVKTGNQAAIAAFQDRDQDIDKLRWVYRNEPDVMAAVYQSYSQVIQKACAGDLATCNESIQEAVAVLYQSYAPSVDFKDFERQREAMFLACMASDPAFDHIRTRWPQMQVEDRLESMRRLARWQVFSYSDGAPPIPVPLLSDGGDIGAAGGMITDGGTQTTSGSIILSGKVLGNDDFYAAASVVIHEVRHVWQGALARHMKVPEGGRWLASNKLLSQASILGATLPSYGYVINVKGYLAHDPVWYRAVPFEQHAASGEGTVLKIGLEQSNAPKCPVVP